MDKYERCGIRMYDLVNPEVFAKRFVKQADLKIRLLQRFMAERLLTLRL